jgi:hypothetical protein
LAASTTSKGESNANFYTGSVRVLGGANTLEHCEAFRTTVQRIAHRLVHQDGANLGWTGNHGRWYTRVLLIHYLKDGALMFPDWSEDFGPNKADHDMLEAINRNLNEPLPKGYHGRFHLLSVEDVKFLIAVGVDPLS